MGTKLEEDQRRCVSRLRFADDVLFLSSSLNQLKNMMTDIKRYRKKWD